MPTLEDRVAQLEKQQSLQTEALKRLFSNNPIAGGAESVQAIMYALDPRLKDAHWVPTLQLPNP